MGLPGMLPAYTHGLSLTKNLVPERRRIGGQRRQSLSGGATNAVFSRVEKSASHNSCFPAKLTGVKEKTSLVRLRLEALIARESARRLANLGGTEKHLRGIRRRRPRKGT
jgi:hypothetical protein